MRRWCVAVSAWEEAIGSAHARVPEAHRRSARTCCGAAVPARPSPAQPRPARGPGLESWRHRLPAAVLAQAASARGTRRQRRVRLLRRHVRGNAEGAWPLTASRWHCPPGPTVACGGRDPRRQAASAPRHPRSPRPHPPPRCRRPRGPGRPPGPPPRAAPRQRAQGWTGTLAAAFLGQTSLVCCSADRVGGHRQCAPRQGGTGGGGEGAPRMSTVTKVRRARG